MPKSQAVQTTEAPVARTVEQTSGHYGWTRTFIYNQLANGSLEALKAGRRTLITTASADRLHDALPKATFRATTQAAA